MGKSVKDKVTNKLRTICEVHREMHDILLEDDGINTKTANKIIFLLEEAYKMAKKMNNKLVQYKHNYDDAWWEENRKFKDTFKKRSERRN